MVTYDLSFSSVSIPANSGGASVTLLEDADGDGTVENSDTISLSDGVTTYTTADVFEGTGEVALDPPKVGPPSDKSTTASITFPVDVTPNRILATVSGPVSTTTSLPDATATTGLPNAKQPTLGNGVEDEIAVDIPDNTRKGDFRVQTRETGETAWDSSAVGWDEQVLPSDSDASGTVSTTVTGREDGEEYEVRVRTETDTETGAWTTPVAITTKFPGATGLTVDATTRSSADLSWTDNADNEDGQRVQKREHYADGTLEDWRTVADAGINAELFTDDTLLPGTTYDFRIQAFTEDASAVSNVVETTTTTPRYDTTRVRAQGWSVEIDHPNGNTLTPTVLEEPTANPRLNGPPSITIEVGGDGWRTQQLRRQPVRVFVDAQRVPVDYLTGVSETPRGYELTARASQALDTHVTASYTQKESDIALRDLISNNTGLSADVDDPASNVAESLIRTGSDSGEWEAFITNAPFGPEDPRRIQNGRLGTHASAVYAEGESGTYSNTADTFFADRFAGGATADMFAIGDAVSWTLSTDYRYPSGDSTVALRLEYGGSTHPGFDVTVDGTVVQSIAADQDFTNLTMPAWFTFDIGADVLDGDHDVEVSVSAAASDDSRLFIDAVALADLRYTSFVDETLSNGGKLAYPRLHASPLEVVSDDVATTRLITGGRLKSQWTSTANEQAIALSDDQGASWSTASNTDSLDVSFPGDETQLRARFSLSYYDSGGGPVVYDAGTEIDLWELYADLEDTPLLIDQVYEGRLRDVLTEICDWSDFVWEYRYVDGTPTISITTPGQRTAAADETVVDYTIEEDFESVVRRAVIFGRSQTESGVAFTSSHGSAVDLPDDWLQPGRETVVDPSDGTQFVRGDDYTMDYQAGTITTLSTGSMSDATQYEISYEARTRGVYESPDYSGDPIETLTETIPAVVTTSAAEQVAFRIVREASSVRKTATIDIEGGPRDWSLIDAVDFAGVPLDAKEIYDAQDTPGGMQLQVANRDAIAETIGTIQSRLSATARNV